MLIVEASRDDVCHVFDHMRAADREEALSVCWTADPREALDRYMDVWELRIGAFAAFPRAGAPPVAIFSGWFMSPGVVSVQMIATDDWRLIAGAATRWSLATGLPWLMGRAHRAECRVMASHVVARRWLERLGFVDETPRGMAFGKDRQRFHLYAREAD